MNISKNYPGNNLQVISPAEGAEVLQRKYPLHADLQGGSLRLPSAWSPCFLSVPTQSNLHASRLCRLPIFTQVFLCVQMGYLSPILQNSVVGLLAYLTPRVNDFVTILLQNYFHY